MAEVRGEAPGSKAYDLASPHLQETPEIVGVVSNTELRSRSDQRLASLEVVPLNASTNSFDATNADNSLHAQFLDLLPKLHTHAAIYFRGIRCPDKKADRIQECVALAWQWFVRLSEKGKDITQFRMVFV